MVAARSPRCDRAMKLAEVGCSRLKSLFSSLTDSQQEKHYNCPMCLYVQDTPNSPIPRYPEARSPVAVHQKFPKYNATFVIDNWLCSLPAFFFAKPHAIQISCPI